MGNTATGPLAACTTFAGTCLPSDVVELMPELPIVGEMFHVNRGIDFARSAHRRVEIQRFDFAGGACCSGRPLSVIGVAEVDALQIDAVIALVIQIREVHAANALSKVAGDTASHRRIMREVAHLLVRGQHVEQERGVCAEQFATHHEHIADIYLRLVEILLRARPDIRVLQTDVIHHGIKVFDMVAEGIPVLFVDGGFLQRFDRFGGR